MEYFPAMAEGATEGSKKKLEHANLYVGIFAYRYGYIENGYDLSVTEIEFDYAGERRLSRLCFLADPSFPWPPDAWDRKHLRHCRLVAEPMREADDWLARYRVFWDKRLDSLSAHLSRKERRR